MKAIATPNLPAKPVSLAAVSATAPRIVQALQQQGIGVVQVEPIATLQPPVAAHSDMQLLHLGGNSILLCKENYTLATSLQQYGFMHNILSENLGDRYPKDISLNFLLLNKCCFGLQSEMPLHTYKHCIDAGLQIVNCKQGYTRCSVAVVGTNAAMTTDPTLHRLLQAHGIDVLKLPAGDILLPGYATGFIGGCCGLLDSHRLAFTGTLERYAYKDMVLAFLQKHVVAPVYLSDSKLLDIGGILPLMEQD